MISFDQFVLEDSGPVYLQIMRFIRQGIAAGVIGDREEVPSRRALSTLLGVNPNTIQKAYHMLEEEGIIQSRSGAKSYTNVDAATVERIRREQLRSETAGWVRAMKQMGISREEACALAGELWEAGDIAGAAAGMPQRAGDITGTVMGVTQRAGDITGTVMGVTHSFGDVAGAATEMTQNSEVPPALWAPEIEPG